MPETSVAVEQIRPKANLPEDSVGIREPTKTSYSETEKLKAVTIFVMTGNLTEVSRSCDIPYPTLKSWKSQAWWPRMIAQVRGEENAKISARYRSIILKTQEKILERVEKGDVVLGKDGDQILVPMKGKDLAVIAGIATQQMERMDDGRILEDQLSVTERLTKIAEELLKMNKKKSITVEETKDGVWEEIKEDEEVNHA